MFRIVLLLAIAVATAGACAPLSAAPLVRVDIVDRDSGAVLTAHPHAGEAWIAGRPGHHYAVRLTNTTGERVLAVVSVDGINAVTGQTADPSQAGYVLAPWQSTEITGWRKSLDDVARFVFTELPDSYAARTGRRDHIGVIGVAAFRERRRAPHRRSPPIAGAPAAADAAATAGRAHAPGARQSIGTGHGGQEWSPVGRTAFVRATRHPVQVTALRYDAPHRLAALGLPVRLPPRLGADARPRAFPGGFVPDPPH